MGGCPPLKCENGLLHLAGPAEHRQVGILRTHCSEATEDEDESVLLDRAAKPTPTRCAALTWSDAAWVHATGVLEVAGVAGESAAKRELKS